jgi:hypothetical protein
VFNSGDSSPLHLGLVSPVVPIVVIVVKIPNGVVLGVRLDEFAFGGAWNTNREINHVCRKQNWNQCDHEHGGRLKHSNIIRCERRDGRIDAACCVLDGLNALGGVTVPQDGVCPAAAG